MTGHRVSFRFRPRGRHPSQRQARHHGQLQAAGARHPVQHPERLVQDVSDGTASSSPAANEPGYKVDAKGNIEFPILGNIHLEGLTLSQASDRIKNLIIDGDYIKAPTVSIEFLNFKYTVWGAVSKNGTFTVESGRITLLEAIANAGDLTNRARLDRVAVIRRRTATSGSTSTTSATATSSSRLVSSCSRTTSSTCSLSSARRTERTGACRSPQC